MLAFVAVALLSMFILGSLVFGAAGRLDLPMVWAYLAVFFVSALLGNFVIHRCNPGLLERRVRFVTQNTSEVPDQLYRVALGVGFVSHYIIAGLDIGRFHWSDNIPIAVQ